MTEKIRYEKPEALDLGGVAPIMGQSCGVGEVITGPDCQTTGNDATTFCFGDGNAAGEDCSDMGSEGPSPE